MRRNIDQLPDSSSTGSGVTVASGRPAGAAIDLELPRRVKDEAGARADAATSRSWMWPQPAYEIERLAASPLVLARGLH